MAIASNIGELIGNTPILRLRRYEAALGCCGKLFAKLESFNPAGSAKDRVARCMLDGAEKKGLLKPGGVVIEPTSGNTGIGLAALGISRGYRVILTMPDNMSQERQMLLRAYGAELVLTPAAEGMTGAIGEAERLSASIPGSFIPSQFDNPDNPAAHYATTGPEIWRDMEGQVAWFVAGVGTGGTLTGTGRYLKEQDPAIKILAIEPADSPLLSGGKAGPHGLQGLGANFIPKNLDQSLMDQICTVTTEEAYTAARELAATEGVLAGISSGAALHGATLLAKRPENQERNIIVLLPDTGERYLSIGLFDR